MANEAGATTTRLKLGQIAWRILGYLRPYRLLCSGVFFFIALSIGLDLAGPKLLGTALDVLRLASGADAEARGELYRIAFTYGVSFLGLGVLAQLCVFRKEVLRTRLNTSVLCDIRTQLYAAIQGLCFRFH